MLALSSNLDENKDKVSEKSRKITLLVSNLLAAPLLPLQTRDQTRLKNARVHRVAKGTMNCAPLKSSTSGHGYTSVLVGVQVKSPVALGNLRNELRSDAMCALATQHTSTTTVWRRVHVLYTAWSSFLAANNGFLLVFVLILDSTNVEFWKERPGLYTEAL